MTPGNEDVIDMQVLNDVLEQCQRNNQRLSDVKRQIEITGRVIDLYSLLQSRDITMDEYRKRLMTILKEW